MKITVRQAAAADLQSWRSMRAALWPEESVQGHAKGIDSILKSGDSWGFIAEQADGTPVGFAEVAIRKYANGCQSQPVPFLEGIWVSPQFRRKGIGALLIEHIGAFLTDQGFWELGSDTQIENLGSQAAHFGWGFAETERVVYFRKSLPAKG